MAMIKCKECGKEISSEARECPHCGKPIIQNNPLRIIGGIVVGIIVYLLIVGLFG